MFSWPSFIRNMAQRRLEWSGPAQRDRQKIVEFYASEASIFIADEAFLAIQAAAEQTRKSPLLYREGKRTGTREHVMRRFPYIIVFKVEPGKVCILRVLHQAMRYFT